MKTLIEKDGIGIDIIDVERFRKKIFKQKGCGPHNNAEQVFKFLIVLLIAIEVGLIALGIYLLIIGFIFWGIFTMLILPLLCGLAVLIFLATLC